MWQRFLDMLANDPNSSLMIRCFSGSALFVFLFVAPEPGQCCSREWVQKLRKNVQCMIGRRRGRNSCWMRSFPLSLLSSLSPVSSSPCIWIWHRSGSLVVNDWASYTSHDVHAYAPVCKMQMLMCWCLYISRLCIADKERSVSFVIITSTCTPSSSNLMQLLLNTIHLKIDESTWLPDYVVRALGMGWVWAMANRCDEHIPLPFRRWVCRLHVYNIKSSYVPSTTRYTDLKYSFFFLQAPYLAET